MTYERSDLAIGLFLAFVAFTLGLSFYLGRKKQSSAGYFAAGGGVPWFVNGVAFAGDYLSAASFLGICGMIAFYGYDGFLYSIGYLAGWVVALLVIAEPVKRLGKFTFADALDAAFQSRGIRLAAAISTLVVSVFYLVPQMVGAGALIQPLFGFPHWVGVVIVGVVVTIIVATAGMASTTWVQFIKGGLLVVFALVLTCLILQRGLTVNASTDDLTPQAIPAGLRPSGHIIGLPNGQRSTGPLDPISFLGMIRQSDVVQWKKNADGTAYIPKYTSGSDLLRPGGSPTFAGLRSDSLAAKLNVISLMLALFCGTASLPHILIRYYTVKDAAAARKSTVVGIATIGGFYILTLFLGLGAMTGGSLDVTKENMAAPLLARSFGPWLFALVSAVAFTTVLGTVSGLILAASGAVVNDLLVGYMRWTLPDARKVSLGKLTAIAVGAVAVVLGIVFEKFNVNSLVGWAFSVAASANLPALVMVLFWKRTTAKGVIASILTGLCVSLPWILLSGETYEKVYGWPASSSFIPFSQPGLVAIPISFAVLVGVSLATGKKTDAPTS